MEGPLFEIVPNISEGRDVTVVDACVAAMERTGVRVIHRTSDRVHHRSVLTAVGTGRDVVAAAVALAGTVHERIDLRAHRGAHPRIGALDVLPFVPLRDATLAEAVALAREAATAIWELWRIPSLLYGAAASAPHRALLAALRRGEFEGLSERWRDPRWAPDIGDVAHPSAGAIAVGARDVLVAFNVELRTGELSLARRIARSLRERDGGLRTLRALGIALGHDRVQVSFNITDYRATPIYRVVELVRILAAREGVSIARCELIGLAPHAAIDESARYYLETLAAPKG